MSEFDEDHCDKLEFNECEDDEYRCMNGMCVLQEYFLDGQFDCLDWSDEIQYYNDANGTFEEANSLCDDRMCPPNEWSCGDGQYISNRFGFLKTSVLELCGSRRDQYYMCEAHVSDRLWILPNGRCILTNKYDELKVENSTHSEKCQFLLKCGFYYGAEKHCLCGDVSPCFSHRDNSCSAEPIEYPTGGLISPYLVYLYSRKIAWSEVKKIPDLFCAHQYKKDLYLVTTVTISIVTIDRELSTITRTISLIFATNQENAFQPIALEMGSGIVWMTWMRFRMNIFQMHVRTFSAIAFVVLLRNQLV